MMNKLAGRFLKLAHKRSLRNVLVLYFGISLTRSYEILETTVEALKFV